MRGFAKTPLPRTEIIAIFVMQALIAGGIFFILHSTQGIQSALSALLGSSIVFFPSLLFACLFFKKTGRIIAKKSVNGFYWGEMVKFLLTAIFFAFAFQWPGVAYGPLFIGFIATQSAYGFIWLFRKKL